MNIKDIVFSRGKQRVIVQNWGALFSSVFQASEHDTNVKRETRVSEKDAGK